MKENKNAFEWFMANVGNFLGGLLLGFSIPVGTNLLSFPDFYLFLPLGMTFLGVSYYYKFVKYKP